MVGMVPVDENRGLDEPFPNLGGECSKLLDNHSLDNCRLATTVRETEDDDTN